MPHNALIKYTYSKLVCSLREGVQRMQLIIVLLPFCEIFNELNILNTSELDFYKQSLKLKTPPANQKEAIFTM
jgi:hypothetical protein